MAVTFKCGLCGEHHFSYVSHFTHGHICAQCAKAAGIVNPYDRLFRVSRALACLHRLDNPLYWSPGCPTVVPLWRKTRALIQHDRILRGEA